ncbi:MAG TPA: hypothetical protein VIK86_01950 [Candidatus Paceibacterota bacterium]
MKNLSLRTKILTGLLTGGMILSTSITSFAATTQPLNTTIKAPVKTEFKQQDLKKDFKKIVTGDILTQNKINKIKAESAKKLALNKISQDKFKAENAKKASFNKINQDKTNKIKAENAKKLVLNKINHKGVNSPISVQNVK